MSMRASCLFAAALLVAAFLASPERAAAQTPAPARWGMVIHGGAGTIPRGSLTPEQEQQYRAKMTEALRAGYAILERGGSSLDAVQATINVMEDSPLFNAGKGAVFTNAGTNEMDAAIMDGRTLQAGAVAGVKHIRNPINLARLVLEKSPHVLLVGEGAEAFAKEQGMEMVPASYFYTRRRWESLQGEKEREKKKAAGPGASAAAEGAYSVPEDHKFGTVGAVALDRAGNLAAGTSTGGLTNKRWGRVGDSPIIGAGTYADNRSCAVSATGTGEYFIRAVVAHDICARMQYLKIPLREAADQVVMQELVRMGGDGGIIAMDAQGNWTQTFNTEGMYRGRIDAAGQVTTDIYKE